MNVNINRRIILYSFKIRFDEASDTHDKISAYEDYQNRQYEFEEEHEYKMEEVD